MESPYRHLPGRRCNHQMSERPTGTVTLLFSDIEGSTVILSRLGAAYADALAGQRVVLRKAWKDHGPDRRNVAVIP